MAIRGILYFLNFTWIFIFFRGPQKSHHSNPSLSNELSKLLRP
jgi:hypothetical protein